MADQYRTVNVPTVGPVNFPASMSDEDVSAAIQKNYPQLAPHKGDAFDAMQAIHLAPQDQGKFLLNPANPAGPSAAPEWNKALMNPVAPWDRNPAPAQPRVAPTVQQFLETNPTAQKVRSGVRKVAQFVNEPLASKLMKQAGGFDPDELAAREGIAEAKLREGTLSAPPHGVANAIGEGVTGGSQALWDFMNELTSPTNIALAAAAGGVAPEGVISRAMAPAFAGQMLSEAGPQLGQGVQNWQEGNVREAVRNLTGAGLSGLMGGLAGLHVAGTELGRLREAGEIPPAEGGPATSIPASQAVTTLRAMRDAGMIEGPWIDRMLEQSTNKQPEQMNLPLRGSAIPAAPAQHELPFSQFRLPPQTVEANVPTDENGQMRLFPNEGQQLMLRPEERAPQTPEGPSAQQELMFPPNPWQMPLDFEQKPPRETPPTSAAPTEPPSNAPLAPEARPERNHRSTRRGIAPNEEPMPLDITLYSIEQLQNVPKQFQMASRPLIWRLHTSAGDIDINTPEGFSSGQAEAEGAKIIGQNRRTGVPDERIFRTIPELKGQTHQAVNPSINPLRSTEALMHPLVSKMLRLRQLSQAATHRLNVQFALHSIAGREEQIDSRGRITGTIFQPNENPLAPQSKTWDQLSKGRKQMVGSVAKVLGIDPRVLGSDQNPAGKWRLTDQQVADLRAALKQGIHVQQATPEEAPFGSLAHPPLAAINTVNAKAAGIPNVRDLWAQTTQAFRERRAARLKDAKSFAAGTDVTGSQAAVQGLRVGTARGMQHEGMLQQELGKDVETLQDEHDAMQAVVAKHLKATQAKLKELIPTWQKLRAGKATPSPLAQKVAALGKESKSLLPKELYAPEHLAPKASESAPSPVAQEPVEAAPSTSGPEGTKAPEGRVEDRLNGLMQSVHEKFGKEASSAFPALYDAVSAKYPNPEHTNEMFWRISQRYANALRKGISSGGAYKGALQYLESLPKMSNDSTTLNANPVIPILNKIFGFAKAGQAAVARQPMNWAMALPSHPIEDLANGMRGQTESVRGEQARAWLDNEIARVQRAWYEVPGDAQAKWQNVQALAKRAWDLWATRPGLDAWDHLMGQRSLTMLSTGLKLAEFDDTFAKQFPNANRRAAIVAWAEAHKDPSDPSHRFTDAEAEQNLAQQASDLEQTQHIARRNKLYAGLYRAAMKLTPEEKDWANKYNQYDAEMLNHERSMGLEHQAALDYFEHIWHKDNFTQNAIAGLRSGAGFGTSANFEQMRSFLTYYEGLKRGFKPNSLDPLYLVSARAMASARVIANRQLVDSMRQLTMPDGTKAAQLSGVGVPLPDAAEPDKTGAILVRQGMPKDARAADGRPYRHIDHPSFRDWKWLGTADDGTPVLGKTDMVVHPDIYDKVKRALEPSAVRQNPIGRGLLKLNSVAKQTLLSLSFFHPVQLATHAIEHGMVGALSGTNEAGAGHVVPRFIRALNPLSGEKFIDLSDPTQQTLVVHGLQLRMFNEDELWDEGLMRRGGVMGTPVLGGAWGSMHNLIFNRFLPNLKMSMAQDILERNMNRYHAKWKAEELQKAGLTGATATPAMQAQASIAAQSRIYRLTAMQSNAAFGGIDWAKLPIGKTGQDMLRLLFLAPDFLAARAGFVVDAARPGGAESRQALGLGFAAQWMLARGLNAWLNNGDSKNDVNDWNRIVIGHKSYSLRSVQGDMMEAFLQPQRFAEHRLNPFWRPAIEKATGRDAWGNPVGPGQIATDAVRNFLPIPLQGIVDNVAPHFWANLRKPKYNENELDTALEGLFGIQPARYLTPAQRYTFQQFDKLPKAQPQTPLEWEQKNSFRYLRDQFRQGKLTPDDIQNAVNGNGKRVPGIGKLILKPSEAQYLMQTQTETRLTSEARQLGPEAVFNAWLRGDQAEKVQLLPVAWTKAVNLPPEQSQAVQAQLNQFLLSLTPEQQEKANDETQAELAWEQSNQ